ncbi:ketoacyl-synthetase C-terminal extension domain-containing protein, partial [Nocardiopsis listeri]|uniref:ketoacyl-synthetase C-terminal extension domain-containing protein n=1 Tax=Nocardiopsis listeri TaxID=53440 RepID=UPI0027383EE7
LHVDEPTSHVDWSAGGVELLTESRAWEAAEGRPRRAGVSSFGVSGTNAHIILEEGSESVVAPAPEAAGDTDGASEPSALTDSSEPGVLAWVVSGAGEEALREQAGRLAEWVEGRDLRADDVAYTLATDRSKLSHRAVVVGSDGDAMLEATRALARGETVARVTAGTAADQDGQIAFVFP